MSGTDKAIVTCALTGVLTDPTPAQCGADRFTAVVERVGRALRIDGRDVYRSTARYAVGLAELLIEGRARPGVLSADVALPAQEVADRLSLKPRRIDVLSPRS